MQPTKALVLPRVAPIVPRIRPQPFSHAAWLFEPKYDGFRGILYLTSTSCTLYSKRGNLMRRFQELAEQVRAELPRREVILDGEIIALDDDGRISFWDLMRGQGTLAYVAFDLLWLNGRDLRSLPLVRRKKRLERLIPASVGALNRMPCFEEEGHQLFDAACRLDLEGIVAKRKADAYAAETAWFKIKNPVYTQAEGRSELFERHPTAHSPHQIDYFCQWPHGHLPYLLALPSPAPLRDSPIRVARICPGEESMPYPPLKILLVEDDAMVRELLARLLESSDYVVEQADNGATALEAARRLDGSLSLVVTDLNMPVMDGLELARTLRRTDRELPILVVTALDPALVTQAGIKADVLVKPFLPDEFLERVAQLVKPVADHGRPA